MRVALLANEPSLPLWQARALDHLLDRGDAELASVVYNDHDPDRGLREAVSRAVELREWAVVAALNGAVSSIEPYRDRVALGDLVDRSAVSERSVDPDLVDGWKQEIPPATVDALADEADVAVRFGFGFLVGPVLSELEHGVLSYHHGDLREYRGQPMGFWEFVHGEDAVGITVQRLTDELDAGDVAALKRVPVDDQYTWNGVRRKLFAESEDMLARAVHSLRAGDLREPDRLGDVYSHPSGLPVAKFAVKNAAGRVRELFRGRGLPDGSHPSEGIR